MPAAEEGGGTQVAHEDDNLRTVVLGLAQEIGIGSVAEARVQEGTAADGGSCTGEDAIHHI